VSRTNIEIDDGLIRKARKLTRLKDLYCGLGGRLGV